MTAPYPVPSYVSCNFRRWHVSRLLSQGGHCGVYQLKNGACARLVLRTWYARLAGCDAQAWIHGARGTTISPYSPLGPMFRAWHLLRDHPHPNVLRVGNLVVSDAGDIGHLCEHLRFVNHTRYKHPCLSTLETFLRFAEDLFLGLDHLHTTLGIVHRDIKPGNVGIRVRSHIEPVIIDFDLNRLVDFANDPFPRTAQSGNEAGTPGFVSPERVLGATPCPANDIWGAMLTLACYLTGSYWWDDTITEQSRILGSILCDGYSLRDLVIDAVDLPDFGPLFDACLSKNPGERPTAREVAKRFEVMRHSLSETERERSLP